MANTHPTLVNLFEDIANAIRERANSNSQIIADTFPTAIRNIPRTIIQNSKTVTPSTSQQTITPDSGYDALGQVIVNALKYQSKTVTPSTSQQTIKPDNNYNALSQVIVNAIDGKVIKTGTFTPTSNTEQFTITHNLGVMPDFCFCCLDDMTGGSTSTSGVKLNTYNASFGYINGVGFFTWGGSSGALYSKRYDFTKSWETLYSGVTSAYDQTNIMPMCVSSVTTSKATLGDGSTTLNNKFESGVKYRWFVGKIN